MNILSLHDALPISIQCQELHRLGYDPEDLLEGGAVAATAGHVNVKNPANLVAYLEGSDEHTTELQSRVGRVCFLAVHKQTVAGSGGADAYGIGNVLGFVREDLINAQSVDHSIINN